MKGPSDMSLALIALQDALSGHYGALSRPKLRLMVKLEYGPVSISRLAEQLHISSPAVSQMIDKLQSDGLVNRDTMTDDQRVVGVSLTEKGQHALATALEAFQARVDNLLAGLDSNETRDLTMLLEKVTHP